MPRVWIILAAVNGLISVGAGAFGAHALKQRLAAEQLATFEVAVRYQMYHALALLAGAWVLSQTQSRVASAACVAFLVGILLFSGSLYGLCFGGPRWLGPVTPIGGLCFLAGWVLLAIAATGLRGGPAIGTSGPE